ncbi:Serine/threonine protein kinase [Actinacidiphila yanglinensis]|uniref:Serine/threonine protein kinase n=1 Tax=Actinacidiphila yanglinensis TaxID=310779 RepID=A0A1H6EAJ4_9ACTN|nr:serine/threonine-protein kinase [Actinacidiphila yanglinensis]SEG94732.1 Serine/threonine protein kinase [Actinacidiphila yanglinensis]
MSLRGGDPAEIGGYPLEARLGSGGMGTVFLAHTSSGRPVAIKLIHQQFAGDDEFRTRFRQEVAAARRVSGAFTAAVVDAATEDEQPWMATTYIEGHTLAERISAKGPLNGAELRRLAIGLAEALRDIHRVGVVHRDLKPSNVVLSPEGPRVIDFGISRAADQQTLTMTGRVIGTPPFMSPEQLQAPRGVGPRSDVFSLGTLLVYAATGRGPFDADSPYMTAYQVVHEEPSLGAVPVALRAVVESCLDKEPAGRPSADELLVLLRDLPTDLGGTDADGLGTGHTRDVITQHHLAMPPASTPFPVPAPDAAAPGEASDPDARAPTAHAPAGQDAPAAPADLDTGNIVIPTTGRRTRRRTRRRLHGRWRPVLAAALAVAAIGGGIAALQGGRHGGNGGGAKTTSVAAARTTPADLVKPWRTRVRGGDVPDELRCVARDNALFCGGGSVVATRIRPADGSQVWTVKSPGAPVSGMHLVGATDDTVIGYRIAPDNASDEPLVTVMAVDADSGKVLWSTPSGAEAEAVTGQAQAAVVAGTAVVAVDGSNSRFEARDAHSGDVLWTKSFPASAECSPVLAGQQLLAMCAPRAEVTALKVLHPTLYTLDGTSGKLGEPIAIKGSDVPMGVADGKFVLLREHPQGYSEYGYDEVVRVDLATRKVAYSPLAKTFDGAPGMVDGTVYMTGHTGVVTALDPATGRQKWSRQTVVEGASGPTAGAGALYFSSTTGRVVALSPDDGKTLWATNPQADGQEDDQNDGTRVAVMGHEVVVAASNNTLSAFDARNPPKAD